VSLSVGEKCGPYLILEKIGAGGMGEVYRARDERLGRDVALKISTEQFNERFEREAKLIAALNHPNIAQIYGLEVSTQPPCIVMELLQGETLGARLQHGAIPLGEALPMAKQMLEALEAAHEKGIVHRDLKPGNVMVLPDGTIKVLDFGLAKVHEGPVASAGISNSPTMLSASIPGSILGTAGYMAPEQAKGMNADARSDLFAFGCIFYEMLTGRRTFEGDSVSEILASVIKTEPDLTHLPADTSTALRRLLQRCLEKNPKNRWHAAADIRLELQSAATRDELQSAPRRTSPARLVGTVLAIAVAAGAGALAVWIMRPAAPPPDVIRLSMVLPENQLLTLVSRPIAISPDGTRIVYFAKGQMYIRSISEFEGKPIPGTEDPIAASAQAFSPDGNSIAYWSVSTNSLKKISVSGGAPVTLASVDRVGVAGVEWTGDGILFSPGYKQIVKIPADGGEQKILVKAEGSERIGLPHELPNGKGILFSAFDANKGRIQIALQTPDSSTRKVLMDMDNIAPAFPDARYLSTGHIVYVKSGTLYAAPFDLDKLQIGNPTPVLPGIRISSGLEPLLSISRTGSLLYMPGSAVATNLFTLSLADRDGVLQALKLQPGPYQNARVSPDGKRVAFEVNEGTESNVWLYELSGTRPSSRFSFGGKDRFPVWSPKGDRIAFQSAREGDLAIFSQPVAGTGKAERLTTPDKGTAHVPETWGPIGDTLLFRTGPASADSNVTLWALSLQDRKTFSFGGVQSVNPTNAAFSPDGRWVAYQTYQPAKNIDEVFVQPFPATGATYQLPVPRDNHHPAWSRGGTELFYIPGPGAFASVGVTTAPSFAFGNPSSIKQVLQNYAPGSHRQYDIAPDGRLLGQIPADQTSSQSPVEAQIHVVVNWFTELQQRSPLK
jgi:serine/threonine protein kinase